MSPGGATEDVHALSPNSRASRSPLIGQGGRPSCVCTCTGWKHDLESLAFRAGKGRGGRETVGGLAVPEPGVRVAGAEDVDAAEPALPLPVREHD